MYNAFSFSLSLSHLFFLFLRFPINAWSVIIKSPVRAYYLYRAENNSFHQFPSSCAAGLSAG